MRLIIGLSIGLSMGLIFSLCAAASSSRADRPESALETGVQRDEIVGNWRLTHMIYRGQNLQLPNPDLVLAFEFGANGDERLIYYRRNEPGFCEHRGRYTRTTDSLRVEILWVNPSNASNCATDPDMRAGRVTQNRIQVRNDELELELPFSDETLIYVFLRD